MSENCAQCGNKVEHPDRRRYCDHCFEWWYVDAQKAIGKPLTVQAIILRKWK